MLARVRKLESLGRVTGGEERLKIVWLSSANVVELGVAKRENNEQLFGGSLARECSS